MDSSWPTTDSKWRYKRYALISHGVLHEVSWMERLTFWRYHVESALNGFQTLF